MSNDKVCGDAAHRDEAARRIGMKVVEQFGQQLDEHDLSLLIVVSRCVPGAFAAVGLHAGGGDGPQLLFAAARGCTDFEKSAAEVAAGTPAAN